MNLHVFLLQISYSFKISFKKFNLRNLILLKKWELDIILLMQYLFGKVKKISSYNVH